MAGYGKGRNNMKSFTIIIVACLVIVGCTTDCKDQMHDTRLAKGEPEEITTYDSRGYHNESWWYWTKGVNFDFTWGKDVDGCQVSRYTFPPIKPVTAAGKIEAQTARVLVERYISPCTRGQLID